MGCWESACGGTHVWNVTANSPVRHEMSETHANDRIENRLRLKPESQVPGDVKGGEKTWIWEENFGDECCDTLTQSTWLEAILPTCSKKARKRFDYDFCAPSQSQSSLALSRLLWLLARCRWDSSNHAFSPWCPKKHIGTCHPKDQTSQMQHVCTTQISDEAFTPHSCDAQLAIFNLQIRQQNF